MKPCSRVGINITKRCNWHCVTCFYRHDKDFNKDYHKPLKDIESEILIGKNGGCKSVIIVGWGEPMLYPQLDDIIKISKKNGMNFSIITNGSFPVKNYENLYNIGMDHLHISVHGIPEILNEISGNKNAGRNQEILLKWLKETKLPWRSNTTLQLINYKFLPQIAKYCIKHGCRHFVSLGFLPHYEWKNKLKMVAVHPMELKKYIQETVDICISSGIYITIRYQPMCHLDTKYWKYVVNARYVVYDPFEWCYGNIWPNSSQSDMLKNAINLGNAVSVEGKPCSICRLNIHCGGWNRFYASEFDGANLKNITKIPNEYTDKIDRCGFLHDLNPVNLLDGTIS